MQWFCIFERFGRQYDVNFRRARITGSLDSDTGGPLSKEVEDWD